MTIYLLDTNHVSPLVTLTHPLRERIFSQRDAHRFAIAVPVLTEMLFGIRQLPRGEQNMLNWHKLERHFIFYDIYKRDAEQAADMRLRLRRQGWQLGIIDALIAAVALRYDLVLLTSDQDFSRVPGLRCENWLRV